MAAIAAAAWATAGAVLLRDARRSGILADQATALGLLLGALLLGIDALPLAERQPLPLATTALIAAACFGRYLVPRLAAMRRATVTLRILQAITVLALLLHGAHLALPISPVLAGVRPLDLLVAGAAAWLAFVIGQRRRIGRAELTLPESVALLACTAGGTGVAAVNAVAPAAMLLLAAAPLPFLLRRARFADRAVQTHAAVALSVAYACFLAAGQQRAHTTLHALQAAEQALAQTSTTFQRLQQPLEEVAAHWTWRNPATDYAARHQFVDRALAALTTATNAVDPQLAGQVNALADTSRDHADAAAAVFAAAQQRDAADGERRAKAEATALLAIREAGLCRQRAAEQIADCQQRLGAVLELAAADADGVQDGVVVLGLLLLVLGAGAIFGGMVRPADKGAAATATTTDEAQGLRWLETVLARLSHELRTPLTTMIGCTELLETLAEADRPAQVTRIVAHGRRLSNLLSDIDDLGRATRGELLVAADTFALDALCHATVAEQAGDAADKGISVALQLDPELPRWVQGDPLRLRQILRTLLENAVRATRVGTVLVAARADGSWLQLTVKDEGPGLPPSSLPHLFDPFPPSLQSGEAPTLSIAMALARRLALAMSGDLVVKAPPGQGCEFRLQLPLRTANTWEVILEHEDQALATAPTAPPTAGTMRGHVLLVEDAPDHQRLVGRLLAALGVEVTVAENGAVALQLLQQTKFDLVLMDMQMPEVDGLTATERLRERGDQTPVVALTADTRAGDVERCLAAGCNSHLAKPVDKAALASTLSMYLPPVEAFELDV